jgi:homoisocitrate dehydrogenase
LHIDDEEREAAQQVLEALRLPITFVSAEAGFATFERTGSALPAATLALCESADAVLFGATQSPLTIVAGYSSTILQLRRHFDLFANVRPALGAGIDLVIVRENTEGMYSGRERVEDGGETAILERVITARASERITRTACELAMSRRHRLTLVHKANVLKETCGLFRRTALGITTEYPQIEVNELLVDSAALLLVQDAARFDVLVTTNLFGDILSDLAAGLTGGLGLAASANVGAGQFGLFEPMHGSAPDIAGMGTADPRAAILSGAMLLNHLGYGQAANRLRKLTYQTAHKGHTTDTSAAIIEQL